MAAIEIDSDSLQTLLRQYARGDGRVENGRLFVRVGGLEIALGGVRFEQPLEVGVPGKPTPDGEAGPVMRVHVDSLGVDRDRVRAEFRITPV